MAQIIIEATAEQIKAVEGIVLDAKEWLQEAWNGKANSCIKRIIIQETDRNPDKMNVEERVILVRNTNFQSRKQKEQ